jgi:hypothetical protein
MLFGQLVGDWEFEWHLVLPGGALHPRSHGRVQFRWILNRTAVQDSWVFWRANALLRHAEPILATVIRFCESQSGVWRVIWIFPGIGLCDSYAARVSGHELIFDDRFDAHGQPGHWIMSKPSPHKIDWRFVRSHDGGRTWPTTQVMTARRVGRVG